jgi:hypothetical protein
MTCNHDNTSDERKGVAVSRRAILQGAASTLTVLAVPRELRAVAATEAVPDIARTSARFLTFHPVDFSQVAIVDGFWRAKQERVARVTLQVCIVQIEQKSGRIRNFAKAARRQGEAHEGLLYDDSDVYKVLERKVILLLPGFAAG